MKNIIAALIIFTSATVAAQQSTSGVGFVQKAAIPWTPSCPSNTACMWTNTAGVIQFYVNSTSETVPSIQTTAKGDVAVFNGTTWVKFARCPDGQVMTALAAAASGWTCAAGGSQTLAQTYAAGASSADSIMSLDSTRGPVIIKDNATPLTGSLFAVQNNAMDYSYIDVNPTENAVQFAVTGPGSYGASISISEIFLGPTALSYSFNSDNTQNVGSSSTQAANVFTRILSAAANTLAIIGGNTQINLSATGFDPNVDAGPTLGTITKRFLSFASKTGTIFYNLMGSSSTQGRGLLMRGSALSATYPGAGQVEYSPLIEFAQSFGQTLDPESGFGSTRWALQGRITPSVSIAYDDRLALLADRGSGTYTEYANFTSTHGETIYVPAVGTAATNGLLLSNSTAAAAGAQQYAPGITQCGNGWKTNATAASQSVCMTEQVRTVQGAAAPTGEWAWSTSINGGAAATSLRLTSAGSLLATSGDPSTANGYSFIDAPTSGMIHYPARGGTSLSWIIGGVELMALSSSLQLPSLVTAITGYTEFNHPARFSGGGFGLTRTTQSGTTFTPGLDGNGSPAQTQIWMTNAAARTVTLPTATSYKNGAMLYIFDAAGTAGAANISVARSGSDTINNGTGTIAVVTQNFAHTTCSGDGTSAWICGVNN